MTRGFYEQIGVASDADHDEIKAAYARAVAHLLRRREATVAQHGDPSALDLARAQLDEAWEALSDPARRRRYDAMLAVAGDGLNGGDLDDLWSQVAGAMIHPAVAAAARIVDASTTLKLGPLPEPPRPTPGLRTTTDTVVDADAATLPTRVLPGFGSPRPVHKPGEPSAAEAPADVVELHQGKPPLRVVTPRTEPGTVYDIADAPPTASGAPTVVPATSTGDVDQLVDELGYGGALLRTLREQHGITLDEMSQTTRISARYLAAVEQEDFGALPPAAAFVRGYVREMARILGLDVDRVVAGYMRRFSSDG